MSVFVTSRLYPRLYKSFDSYYLSLEKKPEWNDNGWSRFTYFCYFPCFFLVVFFFFLRHKKLKIADSCTWPCFVTKIEAFINSSSGDWWFNPSPNIAQTVWISTDNPWSFFSKKLSGLLACLTRLKTLARDWIKPLDEQKYCWFEDFGRFSGLWYLICCLLFCLCHFHANVNQNENKITISRLKYNSCLVCVFVWGVCRWIVQL